MADPSILEEAEVSYDITDRWPEVTPHLNGVPFRCDCGGNVFRWVKFKPGERFLRCNACEALYSTEEG